MRSLFSSSPDFLNHHSHKADIILPLLHTYTHTHAHTHTHTHTHTHARTHTVVSLSPLFASFMPLQAFTGFKIASLYGQEEGCVWTGSSWEELETAVYTAQLRVKSHTQLHSQRTAPQEKDIRWGSKSLRPSVEILLFDLFFYSALFFLQII